MASQKWICTVCGFVYDEEKEGKPFEELDAKDWACPVCRAGKDLFEKKED